MLQNQERYRNSCHCLPKPNHKTTLGRTKLKRRTAMVLRLIIQFKHRYCSTDVARRGAQPSSLQLPEHLCGCAAAAGTPKPWQAVPGHPRNQYLPEDCEASWPSRILLKQSAGDSRIPPAWRAETQISRDPKALDWGIKSGTVGSTVRQYWAMSEGYTMCTRYTPNKPLTESHSPH